MLREIALESPNPNEASRAVFLLAQSGHAVAHSTVVEVARVGSELVQIAAVKELGRFGGKNVSEELLQVYRIGNPRVKYQVVNSLGDRSETTALMKIAQTEPDRRLQETAIIRLGQAGGSQQLRRFYATARPELKRPIINSLFNARAVDELIHIATEERIEAIQQDAMTKLRLLNTQKAQEFLEKQKKK
jgi:HEAT repeat protein